MGRKKVKSNGPNNNNRIIKKNNDKLGKWWKKGDNSGRKNLY